MKFKYVNPEDFVINFLSFLLKLGGGESAFLSIFPVMQTKCLKIILYKFGSIEMELSRIKVICITIQFQPHTEN